jgi:4'-phosphopantetheinyl transferase
MSRLRAMIGYHLAFENSLVGMVMTQGRQREVVNLGLGVKQLETSPPGTSIPVWAESQYHKASYSVPCLCPCHYSPIRLAADPA